MDLLRETAAVPTTNIPRTLFLDAGFSEKGIFIVFQLISIFRGFGN